MLADEPKLHCLIVPKRFVGDAVLTLGLIRRLAEVHPEIRITVICAPHLLNLFITCPSVAKVITNTCKHKALYEIARQYDAHKTVALLLRPSLTDALAMAFAGLVQRVGFKQQRWPFGFLNTWVGLTHAVSAIDLKDNTPHLKLLQQVLSPLGVSAVTDETTIQPVITTTPEDENVIDGLFESFALNPQEKIACINLGTASEEKVLLPEQWVDSLKLLAEKGYQLVAIGGEGDRAFHDRVASLAGLKIKNACGQTTLRQLVVLLSRVHLLFGQDSGPVHMAASVNTPNIVTVYGPINPQQWAPWPYSGKFTPIVVPGLSCRPCVAKQCSHNNCRTLLTSELMAQQLAQALC